MPLGQHQRLWLSVDEGLLGAEKLIAGQSSIPIVEQYSSAPQYGCVLSGQPLKYHIWHIWQQITNQAMHASEQALQQVLSKDQRANEPLQPSLHQGDFFIPGSQQG